jgi:hypothetical protein
MRNHNVFPGSLLDHYTPPVGGRPFTKPHPIVLEDTEDWDVDCILDFMVALSEAALSHPTRWIHPLNHQLGAGGTH